jgi:hypothetical protein
MTRRRRSGAQERRHAEALLGEPVSEVFTVRKDGKLRAVWRRDRSDDTTAAATFARLLGAFGLDQVAKIIKAAPNGQLPGPEQGRRLIAHAKFRRLWRERDTTKPLQTGRLVRVLGVTERTIERWAAAEKIRHT